MLSNKCQNALLMQFQQAKLSNTEIVMEMMDQLKKVIPMKPKEAILLLVLLQSGEEEILAETV